MTLVCEHLHKLTSSEFQQIQEMYESNFPVAERKPFEVLAAGSEQNIYICMVAKNRENPDHILAFAFLLPLPETSVVFLEYIAVNREKQGQGIGSELFRLMVEYFKDHNIANALIWEVEPPDSDDFEDNKNKRIRFYERFGSKMVTLSTTYCMPNYESPQDGGVPLRLMQLPMDQQPDKNEVTAFVNGIYHVAYRDFQNLRDDIIKRLMQLPEEKV